MSQASNKINRRNLSIFFGLVAIVTIAVATLYVQSLQANEKNDLNAAQQKRAKQGLIATVDQAVNDVQGIGSRVVETERVVVPIGGIIMWWGDANKLPDGFELCDGKPLMKGAQLGSKPNLVDKFVKGVGVKQKRGFSGGSHKDSHTHSGTTKKSNNAGPSQGAKLGCNNNVTLPEVKHSHDFNTNVNSNHSTAYNNAPAFVSLYFIIRVR